MKKKIDICINKKKKLVLIYEEKKIEMCTNKVKLGILIDI